MAIDGSPAGRRSAAAAAEQALTAIPFPALVLELQQGHIIAASPAATRLIAPGASSVVGRRFEDFMADRPVPGLDLVVGGRVDGFETFRVIRRPDAADVQVRMWVRSVDLAPVVDAVIVVLVADRSRADGAASTADGPAVVGTADSDLRIERISADGADLFDRPVAALLGTPLLGLVAEQDIAACVAALDKASADQTGVTLYLDLRTRSAQRTIRCEVLLLPLHPSPSCAFVFLPTPDGQTRLRHGAGDASDQVSHDLTDLLMRLGRGAEVAQLARGVLRGLTEKRLPGVSSLTTRELEIVSRILDGDRVPTIAADLVLSQSTVRNHLASVFAKIGVSSQQELLTTIRHARADSTDEHGDA